MDKNGEEPSVFLSALPFAAAAATGGIFVQVSCRESSSLSILLNLGSGLCPPCQEIWESSSLIECCQKGMVRILPKICASRVWGECPAAKRGLVWVRESLRWFHLGAS